MQVQTLFFLFLGTDRAYQKIVFVSYSSFFSSLYLQRLLFFCPVPKLGGNSGTATTLAS